MLILWSLAYILIIFNGIKYLTEYPILMPLLSGSLNFAWEINALIESNGFWGHILWLVLDVAIISLNIRNLKSYKKAGGYVLFTAVMTIALWFIFRLTTVDGMLLSVFIIDLIMAVEYVVVAKKISNHSKVLIATIKLFGDLFAWLTNLHIELYVAIIGGIVLLMNLFYLSYCLELQKNNKK